MAKAIATYEGGIHTPIQIAIREDGAYFERKEVRGPYGYQWSKWRRNGSVDTDDIPGAMYEHGNGREIRKDDSPANYRLPA